MTVKDLSLLSPFNTVTIPSPEREINGAYVGDLLSWVMGKAEADSAWITIMSNVNVVAVASLTDVSCIILAEGVIPDEGVVSTAESKGINILSTDKSAYEAALILGGILK